MAFDMYDTRICQAKARREMVDEIYGEATLCCQKEMTSPVRELIEPRTLSLRSSASCLLFLSLIATLG